MPIRKGKSKRTVSNNIAEIVNSYKAKGTIGTSKPKSKKKAQQQAIAIALSNARKSK